MPLFNRTENKLTLIKQSKFDNEKELQSLIESNLHTIFNCKFVSSEFSTGIVHGGRIDSLALSEDNNPVIIEYKISESSQLVNQSLYYLAWLQDHKGDFEIAVQRAFPGHSIEIDWNDIRVICIAPDYKKYDLHAVKMMDSNIELWQYRYFENGALFFEEVYKKSVLVSTSRDHYSDKNQTMLSPGQKATLTRTTGIYTLEQHFAKLEEGKKHLAKDLQEFILALDESVEEVPKKFYIAYKISQNFVCMEIQKTKIYLYLKIDPKEINLSDENIRDVSNIGHYGTGDLEVTIKDESNIEVAKNLIQVSYNNIGGN